MRLCETLLASLKSGRLVLENRSEVIVIDDSPDEEAERIKDICSKYGALYRFEKGTAGAKRNLGAGLAAFHIILFIYSDCKAPPNLLKQHLRVYLEEPDTIAVVGPTEFHGPRSYIWECVQYTPFPKPFRVADVETQVVWGPSNNLSSRRDGVGWQ